LNPLLEQFLSESNELLQEIEDKLIDYEKDPESEEIVNGIFRAIHTLKGNSGLFDLPDLTKVLHAAEEVMDAVRDGEIGYSAELVDALMQVKDFVSHVCTMVASNGNEVSVNKEEVEDLIGALNQFKRQEIPVEREAKKEDILEDKVTGIKVGDISILAMIPESIRMQAYSEACKGEKEIFLVTYIPDEGCFFVGDDPFHTAMTTPGCMWGHVDAREPWPELVEMDVYRCVLRFKILAVTAREELEQFFEYVLDQVKIEAIPPLALVIPQGDLEEGPVYEDFVYDALEYIEQGDLVSLDRAVESLLELSNPDLWFASALRWLRLIMQTQPDNVAALNVIVKAMETCEMPDWSKLEVSDNVLASQESEERDHAESAEVSSRFSVVSEEYEKIISSVVAAQRQILSLKNDVPWFEGRLKAVAASLRACFEAKGIGSKGLEEALDASIKAKTGEPLLAWLDGFLVENSLDEEIRSSNVNTSDSSIEESANAKGMKSSPNDGFEQQFALSRSFKVDQEKVDLMMNLVGELTVSKNAFPYLAERAESQYGIRELSRQIKQQYTVINRITEELRDTIMQIRMMPVSVIFQRFPRLIRDTSRKLGKKVDLVLKGEETTADKNIIESLADPLIHIVRNSLDHGIETPEARRASGKPEVGTITIQASHQQDRVLIEIQDDGKGIDPAVIKMKAYERGLIDENKLEHITDKEAIDLIFHPGFSTAEKVSELSGRGVGMDVVRTAVERLNGSVQIESKVGEGTKISLLLPLSLAVTNIMIVESNDQLFGILMDDVIETVRVKSSDIHYIKRQRAVVLRGRVLPLVSLNERLGISAEQKLNDDGEYAVLVVKRGVEPVAVIVDAFRGTTDVILKPMKGVLADMRLYLGTALLGDGSIVIALNVKELLG